MGGLSDLEELACRIALVGLLMLALAIFIGLMR